MVSGPFTRAELARFAGVSLEEVDLYQQLSLLQPARRRRSRSGDYGYHREHVERLRFIRRALSLGYMLEDIAKLVDSTRMVTCRDVYDATMHRVREAEAHEPKRAAALAQLAETCPRKGRRVDCPILAALKNAKPAAAQALTMRTGSRIQ